MNLRLNNSTFHRLTALVLFCACLLNAFSTGFEIVRAFRESPVAAAAIRIDKTLEICPHHPEGCPKSCLCPKTRIHMDESNDSAPQHSSTLNEPSWVTCNEGGTSLNAPAFALFIATEGVEIPWFASIQQILVLPDFLPRSISAAPPQKIPIV